MELTTKISNLSSMRNELVTRKKLYGNITRKSNNSTAVTSTLRSTWFSGFSSMKKN